MVLFFEINPEFKMYDDFDPDAFKDLIFQIASIGLILNAGLFFASLRFNKELVSRGVLHASLVFLIAISLYRFVF